MTNSQCVHDLAWSVASDSLGSIRYAVPLSNSQHNVFKIQTGKGEWFVLKLHSADNSIVGNFEINAYRHLSEHRALRRCVAHGQIGDSSYIILEWVDGRTILECVTKGTPFDVDSLATQLVDFIHFCGSFPTKGFGTLDAQLFGSSASWRTQIEEVINHIASRSAGISDSVIREILVTGCAELHKATESNPTYLASVVARLTPIDLNLSNLLVDTTGRLIVLDLGAFWGADPRLALGEWLGHTWGDTLGSAAIRAWGPMSFAERFATRCYALLSNISTLLYSALHSTVHNTSHKAHPWGNPLTFDELLRGHVAALAVRGPIQAEDMLLSGTPIKLDWGRKLGGSNRTCATADILGRLRAVQRLAGITRVADITNLDRTGVPVYQAVRPEAETGRGTFTIFSGNGQTPEQAQVAAIAESIERLCAERRSYDESRVLIGSWAELMDHSRVVHPSRFNMPDVPPFQADEPIEWVAAFDINSGIEWFVPACTVFYPYVPRVGRALFPPFTTGLAAGASLVEVLAHGMGEVIERDAAMLNLLLRASPSVSLDSIDNVVASEIIDRFRHAELNVIIRSITAPDVQVPVFSVICEDTVMRAPLYVNGGYGAHPDKDVALMRALNEAAHSRCGAISGAREDLQRFLHTDMNYEEYKRKYSYWFDTTGATIDYGAIPSHRFPTVLEDVAFMASRLSSAGFHQILLADLSHSDLDLHVGKVLVPGVERYTFNRVCVGSRARSFFRARYGRELPTCR
jgi:YcaO-like protein with predicted kinase domain